MKFNQLKFGAILSYVIIVLNMIVGLIYTPILIRYLGQSEYGLYSLIASIITYLTVLDFGFGNAIIIYITRYRLNKEKEKEHQLNGMFIIIYTIIGIFATLIGTILYFNINNLFSNSMTLEEINKAKIMILILTFNLAITFPFSIFSYIIIAYEKFIFSKVVSIIRIVLIPCVMLPLLILGYKSIAMVTITTLLNLVCLLINTFYCFKYLKIKITFGKFDFKLLKEIFAYSIYIFLASVADRINWSVDQFILGVTSGTITVAIYGIASQFNEFYIAFSTAISNVLLPKVTKMVEEEKSEKEVSNLFIKIGRIQYIVMALIIVGFIIFGKEFINIWAGKEYNTAYYIACILMIPVTIPLIQNVGISILQAKNKHKFRTLVYLIIAIGNVSLSIPLAKIYGGIGSAIGTAISIIIGQIIIMNIYYYKKIHIDIPRFYKEILKMTIPVFIVFTIGFFINKYWIPTNIIILGIQVFITVSLYGILMFCLGMNRYEKDLFTKPVIFLINFNYFVKKTVLTKIKIYCKK